MGQYTSASHNPGQFPPGAGQPNPPQYYKVITRTVFTLTEQSLTDSGSFKFLKTLVEFTSINTETRKPEICFNI